ncbi:hypothetical protein E6O75_ATG04942 [Venturia nashicola]|uniref:Sulfate transporter family protein n=1 Tax=Venturia nashicola TaxID=86259 RepID=A0A4Z1PHB3_9PEZI|nr:hypothetical protein E6O75_ATG04942 [Venturia nashicola]
MSGRFFRKPDDAQSLQQRLPFSTADIEDEAVSSEPSSSLRIRNPKSQRAHSVSSHHLSSSYNQRQPTRSFYHHASSGQLETPQYASQGVREQTQELASWALGDSNSLRSGSPNPFHNASNSDSDFESRPRRYSDSSQGEGRQSVDSARPGVIKEVSEPQSPEDTGETTEAQPSALSNLIRHGSPPNGKDSKNLLGYGTNSKYSDSDQYSTPSVIVDDVSDDGVTERTTLLPTERLSAKPASRFSKKPSGYSHTMEMHFKNYWAKLNYASRDVVEALSHPRQWNLREASSLTIGALAAVFLGLLLNILDALSYGMILFPLSEPIFDKTGPDGISMFYVSCIVSQVVYSLGGSRFKGGVGSEMIEVVPFFHKMAYMILNHVGRDGDPKVVMATVITSYALSSVLTGLIFLALSYWKLGDLVSFFPRSILLGCIGGVGVFLFLTGLEVSAGLDLTEGWTAGVLRGLVSGRTLPLWMIPLSLAILLMVVRHYLAHPSVMPAFFVAIVGIFFIVFAAIPNLHLQDLRAHGWVFDAPEAGVPFWNFYTYYDFKIVNWTALSQTIPTMFALSFFGIIHVPINVPALGIAVQEDDVNINRELLGHGISNMLSGLVGSIQNYLVFANSRLFIQNGGNSRWAGILLAIATTGVWIAGPAMIGYIPKMVVGTLIFMLGIEMIQEALWDTFGRLHRLEWLTVFAITLVMGFHDFVVGIIVGIGLACLLFVVQTSRISAVRATFLGTVAESTVRRHPVQRKFLRAVGSQICVTKLAGFLFFGTIVAVEKKIRDLIEDDKFRQQPIRYLILDFDLVTGVDFSAGEAFVRMHRILGDKQVEMVLSNVCISGEIGKSLSMVGLLSDGEDELRPPKVFEDLNQALEMCENELLIVAFKNEDMIQQKGLSASSMTIPRVAAPGTGIDAMFSSPRRTLIQQAATTTLNDADHSLPTKWQNFAQPLPLILQAFKDLSTKDLDFWNQAVPYFERREYQAGRVLYSRGDDPDGFYLLEDGILRADYQLEQGSFHESIVAGTTCGELPFFAETERSGTVVAEKDTVVWLLTKQKWEKLELDKRDVAMELLKIGLKLTSERMNTITSYVLVKAS